MRCLHCWRWCGRNFIVTVPNDCRVRVVTDTGDLQDFKIPRFQDLIDLIDWMGDQEGRFTAGFWFGHPLAMI